MHSAHGCQRNSLALCAERQGVGDGVVVAVAEAEAEFGDAEASGGLGAFSVEDDEGFAAGFAADFDVEPAERGADTGTEGFGDGFLGGEARGVAALGGGHFTAIGAFAFEEDAGEEAVAVTREAGGDAGGFHDVHAGADDVHRGLFAGHRGEHLGGRAFESGEDCAGDDRMADIEFDEVRDGADLGDVPVVDAVTGIDLDAEALGMFGGGAQAQHFAVAILAERVGEGTRVKFDDLHAELARGFDLIGLGFDEKTDADAGALQSLDGGRERFDLADGVEAAFGRDFGAIFGNEADFLG